MARCNLRVENEGRQGRLLPEEARMIRFLLLVTAPAELSWSDRRSWLNLENRNRKFGDDAPSQDELTFTLLPV